MKDNGLKLQERKRFTDNAFFLWNHRKRILSDNRMSQCRLYIGNNLAFINVEGIASNTLGGYLTWWKEFERSETYEQAQPTLLHLLYRRITIEWQESLRRGIRVRKDQDDNGCTFQ